MAKEANFSSENISLYIDYQYLTMQQFASIIEAINGIYKELADTLIYENRYDNPVDIFPYDIPFTRIIEIPLCIEQISTGNSINTKFSFDNKFFPSFEIENSDTLKIILPKWSATLIIAGAILSFGFDKYEQYLDIRIKELEIIEKENNIKNPISQELKKQSEKLTEAKNKPSNRTYVSIQKNYYAFQSEIQQSNIKVVEVNGIVVKNDSIAQDTN